MSLEKTLRFFSIRRLFLGSMAIPGLSDLSALYNIKISRIPVNLQGSQSSCSKWASVKLHEKKNVVLLHDDAERWMMPPLKTNITYAPRWIGAQGGHSELGYGYCDIPLLRGKGAVLFSRWAHVAASVGSSGVQEWRRQMLPLQAKDSAMIIRFGWHLRVGYGLRREAMRYGFRQLIFTILDSWNYYHVRGLLAVCIGAVINWITLPYIISSSLRTR